MKPSPTIVMGPGGWIRRTAMGAVLALAFVALGALLMSSSAYGAAEAKPRPKLSKKYKAKAKAKAKARRRQRRRRRRSTRGRRSRVT